MGPERKKSGNFSEAGALSVNASSRPPLHVIGTPPIQANHPRKRLFDVTFTVAFLGAVLATSLYFEWKKGLTNLFVRDWVILAGIPFEGSAEDALRRDWLEQSGGELAFRPVIGKVYRLPSKEEMSWIKATSATREIALLSYNGNLQGRDKNIVAYAYATVTVPSDRRVMMGFARDDGAKVWINGKVVYESSEPLPFKVDGEKIPVELHAGENTILVKVTQVDGGWGFALHLSS